MLNVAERACFILRYGCVITHSRRVFILTHTSARNAVQRRQGVCAYRLSWLCTFSAASSQLFTRQSLLCLWMYINLAERQIFSISFQFISTRLWKATGRGKGWVGGWFGQQDGVTGVWRLSLKCGTIPLLPPRVFVALCLITHRDNSTVPSSSMFATCSAYHNTISCTVYK